MNNTNIIKCSNCSSTDHLRRECPLVKCVSCGRLGHFKEDCPSEKKRARTEEDIEVCRKCGSSRHPQSSCPLRIQSMECYQCHQRGHMMPTCPQTRCFNCGSYGHSSQRCHSRPLCFHCSLSGHTSSDCPMKQKGRVCYRCKEPGHEMAECTQSVVCNMCNQAGHLFAQCPEVECSRCHEKGHLASSCSKLRCLSCSGHHTTSNCRQNLQEGKEHVNDASSVEENCSHDSDGEKDGRSDSNPATIAPDDIVPAFIPSGIKHEGRVAVIIDGGYFERILKTYNRRDEEQYKRTVEVLRYTLDFIGEIFQKNPVAYWFDTDPAAFTEYIETSMPLHHREKAFRESHLRKRLLLDEMNGGRQLSNVVARLVGGMKRQKGYTRDGPRYVWVQTGVDVAMATCVIETFLHRQFEQVVLLCGDSDLYPAIHYCHGQRRGSSVLERTHPVRICGTSSSISKIFGRDQDLSDFLPRILLDMPQHVEGGRETAFPTHTIFASNGVEAMKNSLTKSQQTNPTGVPVTYYETCRRIECLASLGMPQVTPYTDPPKPNIITLPECQEKMETDITLRVPSPITPNTESRSAFTMSRTLTPRTAGRRRREIDRFDMETAYTAFIQRLEQQIEEEDIKLI